LGPGNPYVTGKNSVGHRRHSYGSIKNAIPFMRHMPLHLYSGWCLLGVWDMLCIGFIVRGAWTDSMEATAWRGELWIAVRVRRVQNEIFRMSKEY
jgi:hypothetical protein